MFKKLKYVLMFALALSLTPVLGIEANENNAGLQEVAEVSDLVEFKEALGTDTVHTIKLTDDIVVPDVEGNNQIVINRAVTIDGQGKFTITGTNDDPEGWSGHYLLHVWNVTGEDEVVIKDIKLTEGNAGLLVSGSNVTLKGNVDLSGNGFGGIEVQSIEEQKSLLDITDVKITHTSEHEDDNPAIWIDEDNPTDVIKYTKDGTYNILYNKGDSKAQTFYLVNPYEVTDIDTLKRIFELEDDNEELRHVYNVKLGKDINYSNNEEVPYMGAINIFKSYVTLDGGGHTFKLDEVNAELTGLRHVLQVYNTKFVTIKDITLTGGYSGLNVISSEVTLTGDINVSGNEVGIAVGRGSEGLNFNAIADVTDARITNDSETKLKPTISLDKQRLNVGKGFVSLIHNGVSFHEVVYNDTHINYFLEDYFANNSDDNKTELEEILKDKLSAYAPKFDGNKIVFSRINEDTDLTVKEIVNIVSTLIKPGQLFSVNGYAPVSFETIQEIIEYVESVLNRPMVRTIGLNNTVDLTLFDEDGFAHEYVLEFNLTADIPEEPEVPTEEPEEPTEKPEEPTEEPEEKPVDPAEKPEQPTEDVDTPEVPEKADPKTPGTGIMNTGSMNVLAILLAISLLVILRKKRIV